MLAKSLPRKIKAEMASKQRPPHSMKPTVLGTVNVMPVTVSMSLRLMQCLLPQVAGIGVVFTANASVINNTIVNPVADVADTGSQYAAPYASPTAIFLDCLSGNITIADNRVVDADPTLVTQVGPPGFLKLYNQP